MSKFKLGQIVKQNHRGVTAHYAIVVAENRTIGWVNSSQLEVKPIEGQGWEAVPLREKAFEFEQIKRNIKSFKEALEQENARKYHLSEFNCEHWATLMVTGKSYSTQSGIIKFGSAEIVGGTMIGVGASAGTVVTIAGLVGATASTGTAISGLSGAAATNAALAWLGGGTLASGGGGIAAGAAIVGTVSTGGAVIAIAGVGIIGKKVWDNLNEAQRQEIIEKIDNSTPEQVKIAYGVTVEKATQIFGISSNWIGKQTTETSNYIEKIANSENVKIALNKTTEITDIAGKTILKQTTKVGESVSNFWTSWRKSF